MNNNIDVQVTRELRIENEAAGSVIGKGGQKVGEIRKISGAQVKVKFPGNKVDRKTSPTGPHFNRGGADGRRRENGDLNRNS